MRKALIVIGVLVAILGVADLVTGVVNRSFVFIVWGVVLVASIVFERFRYKQLEAKSPGPGWQRTTERFVDDDTGALVTVYIQPETGERAYVKD